MSKLLTYIKNSDTITIQSHTHTAHTSSTLTHKPTLLHVSGYKFTLPKYYINNIRFMSLWVC
jgi:hypothetical protein